MPAGTDVTVPPPLPSSISTVSVTSDSVKVAVTIFAESSVTTQVPRPLHPPPDQPSKSEPVAALAVSVTIVFGAYCSMQSVPQLMPGGFDDTMPMPLPASATISVFWRTKFAVAVLSASSVTVHVSMPLHAPVQPTNSEPVAALAVSVTVEPAGIDSVQSLPQLMPAGFDETEPLPLPVFVTVNVALFGSASGSGALLDRQTPATQSSPGGHSSFGPHAILPS